MCFCERISLKFFLSFFTSRSGGSTKMNAGSFVPSNGCTKSSPVEEFSPWYTGNFCHIYHRSDCHDCLRRGTCGGGGIEETNSCTTWPSELFKRSKNQDQEDQTPWDCLTRRSAHFWDAKLARIWTTTNFQCVLPRNEQPLVDRFSQSWTIFVQMSFGHYHQYLQDSTVACRG